MVGSVKYYSLSCKYTCVYLAVNWLYPQHITMKTIASQVILASGKTEQASFHLPPWTAAAVPENPCPLKWPLLHHSLGKSTVDYKDNIDNNNKSYHNGVHVHVMRKVWICAIHGLFCAKYRLILCATKYGFVVHSMDCPVGTLRKVWIKWTRSRFALRSHHS